MKKIAIIYAKTSGALQKRAVEVLSSTLLDYTLEYPVCFDPADAVDFSAYRCIYLGTKASNPYLRAHSQAQLSRAEEYCIRVEQDTIMIEGFDDAGVLYGAIDFYAQYIIQYEYPDNNRYHVNFFEQDCLPDFVRQSAPSVKERGLWTWGHVIYDYKGYLDHMMRLKMNRVVIWNDFAPANARDIVEYAHTCNIKVIWGFSWLWDTNCAKVDMHHLEEKSAGIFAAYERDYAGVGGDGIYFQTFTELRKDSIDGVLIAEAAAKFVNQTAALFYDRYPEMEIQFGLHATSVKHHLAFIQTVDPRIRIVWEDCGAFPFSYMPRDLDNFAQTQTFVRAIANLRGDTERFGAVTKGLVKLDWSQFSHSKGPHCIGVCSERMRENRVTRKHLIWKYIQAYWLIHADKAYEMVQEMCRQRNGDLCILALVEDGMFEENILYPVALYAQMLWDAENNVKRLMSEVALRDDVTFA